MKEQVYRCDECREIVMSGPETEKAVYVEVIVHHGLEKGRNPQIRHQGLICEKCIGSEITFPTHSSTPSWIENIKPFLVKLGIIKDKEKER